MAFQYALVARGSVVLADLDDAGTNAGVIVRQILEKIPGSVSASGKPEGERRVLVVETRLHRALWHTPATPNDTIPDSHDFASSLQIPHAEIESVIKSLFAFEFIVIQDVRKERLLLTEVGKSYAANGSPEVQVFLVVPPGGISGFLLTELEKKVGAQIYKIGHSQVRKSN